MTTILRTQKQAGKVPALIVAPLLLVVFLGGVVPRLLSRAQPQKPGQIDWKSMNGYELSVARKYPHLRRGYERALARDQAQLHSIDRRISAEADPDIRKGLEQQRSIVSSGIDVVEQILAHFPAETTHSRSAG